MVLNTNVKMFRKDKSYVLKPTCNEIMRALEEQRRQKDTSLCDVTLAVEGVYLMAHKAILAGHSNYFHQRFLNKDQPPPKIPNVRRRRRNQTKACKKQLSLGSLRAASPPASKRRRNAFSESLPDSSLPYSPSYSVGSPISSEPALHSPKSPESTSGSEQQEVVVLPGMEAKAFNQVLDYMYAHDLHITEENVCEILFISHLLQIRTVLEACVMVLSKETRWKLVAPQLTCSRSRTNTSPQCIPQNVARNVKQLTTSSDRSHVKGEVSNLKDKQHTLANPVLSSPKQEAFSAFNHARDSPVVQGNFHAVSDAVPHLFRANKTSVHSAAIPSSLSYPEGMNSLKTANKSGFMESKNRLGFIGGQLDKVIYGKSDAIILKDLESNRMASSAHRRNHKQEKLRRKRTVSECPQNIYDANNALDLRQRSSPDDGCYHSKDFSPAPPLSYQKALRTVESVEYGKIPRDTSECPPKIRKLSPQKPARSLSNEAIDANTLHMPMYNKEAVKSWKNIDSRLATFKANTHHKPTINSVSNDQGAPRETYALPPPLLPAINQSYLDKLSPLASSRYDYNGYAVHPMYTAFTSSNQYQPPPFPNYSSVLCFPKAQRAIPDIPFLTTACLPMPSWPFGQKRSFLTSHSAARSTTSMSVGIDNKCIRRQDSDVNRSRTDVSPIDILRSKDNSLPNIPNIQQPASWKRKMLAQFADSGTDAESSDSGVVESHRGEHLRVNSIDDLSAKSPPYVSRSTTPPPRFDQSRLKEPTVSRQEQCVV
ncbi:uncharacterized protein LOC143462434 [Clavelina lepadiformis]|uniref:uncharacterized protein LOC143462434 n=1 Tax=Clavelina lepadiformis TaxID=159417 RepID=UPI004041EBFF